MGGVSAAWQEERGRDSQSFISQTVRDSEPPHLCDSGAYGQIPPPVRSTSENGGCKSLPSGCHIRLGQAKVTTEMDSLWLMQTNEMH